MMANQAFAGQFVGTKSELVTEFVAKSFYQVFLRLYFVDSNLKKFSYTVINTENNFFVVEYCDCKEM